MPPAFQKWQLQRVSPAASAAAGSLTGPMFHCWHWQWGRDGSRGGQSPGGWSPRPVEGSGERPAP